MHCARTRRIQLEQTVYSERQRERSVQVAEMSKSILGWLASMGELVNFVCDGLHCKYVALYRCTINAGCGLASDLALCNLHTKDGA